MELSTSFVGFEVLAAVAMKRGMSSAGTVYNVKAACGGLTVLCWRVWS
jgi:hypothetical protein